MKQTIVTIHGGDTFNSYQEYLADLEAKKVNLDDLKTKYWKSTLEETLGEGYEVLSPRMPNSNNAQYLEWRLWFSKFAPLFPNNVILLGHSLGGIFLAKYLAEEDFPQPIRATFLVAAPYAMNVPTFSLPSSLEKFAQQSGEIFIYHSQDDPVVPFSDAEKYQEALPQAHLRVFTDRQHFNQPEFPEIIQDIQSLR